MLNLSNFLDFIRPPQDATPKQISRWITNASICLVGFFLYAAWSFTDHGFARAETTRQLVKAEIVEQKIATAVDPLRSEVAELKRELGALRGIVVQANELATESQAAAYAAKILDYKEKQCAATTPEAARLWRDLVTDFEARYSKLTGVQRPAPGCNSL